MFGAKNFESIGSLLIVDKITKKNSTLNNIIEEIGMFDFQKMAMLSRITELEENSPEQSREEASMVLVSPISGIVGLMNSTLLSVDSLKRRDDKEAEPYQGEQNI